MGGSYVSEKIADWTNCASSPVSNPRSRRYEDLARPARPGRARLGMTLEPLAMAPTSCRGGLVLA